VDPSKIRIRTPLFWVHIFCAFALFFALGIALDLGDRSEPYDRDPAVQQFWMTLSVALAGISIPVGLAAAALEVAVLRGYDPKFLARRMYGVTVADVAPSRTSHHVMLYVLHRDGNMHEYRVEPGEAHGLRVGDVRLADKLLKQLLVILL
jgi:hypothetical protein